jgi:hypothetical protein
VECGNFCLSIVRQRHGFSGWANAHRMIKLMTLVGLQKSRSALRAAGAMGFWVEYQNLHDLLVKEELDREVNGGEIRFPCTRAEQVQVEEVLNTYGTSVHRTPRRTLSNRLLP